MSGNQSSPWISFSNASPRAEWRLFCFPNAGGSDLVFRDWRNHLPEIIEVCPIMLPGRGRRLREKPLTNLRDAVDALVPAMLPYLDKPFALYGHSMGAAMAHEIALELRRQHHREPRALFVSGRRAPQVPRTEPLTYTLPDSEFIEELRRLNGTPREVLEHHELMRLMIPILRADFEMVETYAYTAEPPLDYPLHAFGGLQDPKVTRETVEAWREHTTSTFSARMLPGDHFFIQSNQALFLRLISKELLNLIKEDTPDR
jgi:medium-chain acyl-[acyl-carrier-protein] hydrolase